MAKKRGRLQEALKGFQQQKQGQKRKTPAASGAPAAKKQKTASSSSQPPKKKQHKQPSQARPTIPFRPSDAILLIGEADLSFAASLVSHHKCTNLLATVLEKDEAELVSKYPHCTANISTILSSPGKNRIRYAVDARKMPPFLVPGPGSQIPGKSLTKGAMDVIIFNFPHVGGKSTDVNRQVRYNQEMLVDFFKRALPSLAPGGKIVVTLFEGEPYTLWNIRDLARHAGGLEVLMSFKFQAGAYPGYKHARTLGVVKNKKGEEAKAAWKGEEREARSYVFVRKGEGQKMGTKRKGSDDESSDEEDERGDGEGWGDEEEEGWDDEGEDGEEEEEEDAEKDQKGGEKNDQKGDEEAVEGADKSNPDSDKSEGDNSKSESGAREWITVR